MCLFQTEATLAWVSEYVLSTHNTLLGMTCPSLICFIAALSLSATLDRAPIMTSYGAGQCQQ